MKEKNLFIYFKAWSLLASECKEWNDLISSLTKLRSIKIRQSRGRD